MSTKREDMVCRSCYFYDPRRTVAEEAHGEETNQGECHRNPPVIHPDSHLREPVEKKRSLLWATWPVVAVGYWCGEWRPG